MTHQQPTTNRAFQEMRKPALDRLADRVPEELSARTGIPFDRQRQVFSLSSLGRNMEIDYPGYEIRPAVDDWHHLLILHYLDLADGKPLSHQLMAFGDLPSGMVRGGGFDRQSEQDLGLRLGHLCGRISSDLSLLNSIFVYCDLMNTFRFNLIHLWFYVRRPICYL